MELMTDLMSKLSKEQQEAAKDIYGPSMVVAGPGAGKTFTLVTRTANMIHQGVPPSKIILFTFTKKAALEIKERVVNTIGPMANSITVGTYHSVCSRLLRKYCSYLGLTKSFSICDADDCKKIVKDILKAANLNFDPSTILNKISDFKGELLSPSDVKSKAKNSIEERIAEIYQIYTSKMQKENLVDFDDLIYRTVRLLEYNPEVKAEVNKAYQYIVAEFIGPYYGDVVCVSL